MQSVCKAVQTERLAQISHAGALKVNLISDVFGKNNRTIAKNLDYCDVINNEV